MHVSNIKLNLDGKELVELYFFFKKNKNWLQGTINIPIQKHAAAGAARRSLLMISVTVSEVRDGHNLTTQPLAENNEGAEI